MTNHKLPSPIETPDQSSLGPAMRELTEKQQRFVIALVEIGGNQTKAAALAGYSQAGRMHSTLATLNMRNEKVIAAIKEEADKRLRAGTLLASSVLIEIAGNSMHKDQLKAATELLNRGGLMTVQKIEIAHTLELKKRNENEATIIEEGAARGLTPRQALGYDPSHIEDADFTEVTEDEIEW